MIWAWTAPSVSDAISVPPQVDELVRACPLGMRRQEVEAYLSRTGVEYSYSPRAALERSAEFLGRTPVPERTSGRVNAIFRDLEWAWLVHTSYRVEIDFDEEDRVLAVRWNSIHTGL